MAFIKLENLSVEFPIYHLQARSLKKQFIRLTTGGKLLKSANDTVMVHALDNINLELKDGDRVGLIGHNGAGKSTLLRVLSQIYEPTQGNIHMEGHVTPLLDVLLGMNDESTGYENIFLRGILLGYTRKEIHERAQEIAEFTELGDYLNMPVRTYSTGMRLRLAFGVSTSIASDILVIDEVVGTGDANFFEKAQKRLNDLIHRASIVVLSSHSPDIIQRICNKILLLDHGQVKFFGSVEEGIAKHWE